MLTLFDYLPSQNAWKVRQLLQLLQHPCRTVPVSIFEGAGQTETCLRISPSGTVPAIRLDDGPCWPDQTRFLRSSLKARPACPTIATHARTYSKG